LSSLSVRVSAVQYLICYYPVKYINHNSVGQTTDSNYFMPHSCFKERTVIETSDKNRIECWSCLELFRCPYRFSRARQFFYTYYKIDFHEVFKVLYDNLTGNHKNENNVFFSELGIKS
jgi:hypothetical protein